MRIYIEHVRVLSAYAVLYILFDIETLTASRMYENTKPIHKTNFCSYVLRIA